MLYVECLSLYTHTAHICAHGKGSRRVSEILHYKMLGQTQKSANNGGELFAHFVTFKIYFILKSDCYYIHNIIVGHRFARYATSVRKSLGIEHGVHEASSKPLYSPGVKNIFFHKITII